jgi:hypothetical protein
MRVFSSMSIDLCIGGMRHGSGLVEDSERYGVSCCTRCTGMSHVAGSRPRPSPL